MNRMLLPNALAEKSSTQQAPYVTSAMITTSAFVYFSIISAIDVANRVNPSGNWRATLVEPADLIRQIVLGIYIRGHI